MGKHKDKYGKTRLGIFIKKAGVVVPEALDLISDLGTGDIKGVVESIGNILEGRKDESPEIKALSEEFQLKRMEMENEAFRAEVEDRESARSLWKDDSIIQKVFSIVFLLSYIGLSYFLLTILMGTEEMPKLAETMITMIWTSTSTKLGTIIDFFFGGSSTK